MTTLEDGRLYYKLGVCSTNLVKHWDDYLYKLKVSLDQQGSYIVNGFGTGSPPLFGVELRASDNGLESRLVFTEILGPLEVWVVGASLEVLEREVEIWKIAHDYADNKERPSKPWKKWAALIGELQGGIPGKPLALSKECKVGNLRILAGDKFMWETSFGGPGGEILSSSPGGSWPSIVSGRSQAFDAWQAGDIAKNEVSKLCNLLSLATASPWGMRLFYPTIESTLPEVPEYAQYPNQNATSEAVVRLEVGLSGWLPKAWEVLKQKSKVHVLNAMAIYRQGLLLAPSHSSLAMISYIASIEAIGRKGKEPPRCETCNQIIGSRNAFQTALEKHLSTARIERISWLYAARSKTVHDGVLHESESWSGRSFSHNPFELLRPSPSVESETRFELPRSAREIILAELGVSGLDFDPDDRIR